ncbi:MAG TPA: phage GP46 family protein [Stellaceae bacterium]|nr:phage GP46 family protein [Stellaceae bacterium]
MTDIAIVWDEALLEGDFVMAGSDLRQDQGLEIAVIISLMTDRLANADDVIPDGTTDRRGWWGDLPLASGGAGGTVPQPDDLIGSRLWLLSRAKMTPQTLTLAQQYCQEALQWLVDDGVAAEVDVETSWIATGQMGIAITIARQVPGGAPVNQSFNLAWSMTLGMQG